MSESDLPIDPAIAIQAETSLVDPDTCKFTVSRTVHPGGPFFFDDRKRARPAAVPFAMIERSVENLPRVASAADST